MEKFHFKEETSQILAACIEVQKTLGRGFKEVIYQDALEVEFFQRGISFEREKLFDVNYKGTILKHRFYVDFLVFGKVILELKACRSDTDEFYRQLINYLAVSKCKVGLMVNFNKIPLETKRVVL